MECSPVNYKMNSSILGILIFSTLIPIMIIAKLILSYKMK